jgi:hypothetical protein
MGLDKFFDERYNEKLDLPNNDYKTRVNRAINSPFDLMNLEERMSSKKKVPMSIYFNEEDLDLLKAIAYNKNLTVNQVLMNILDEPLRVTFNNLPVDFNIKSLARKYNSKCRKRKNV